MESASKPIRWRIATIVADIHEREEREYLSGYGEGAIFKIWKQGWYVRFEGSWEALYVGDKRPNLEVGERVAIIIQKEPDVLPQQPPVE